MHMSHTILHVPQNTVIACCAHSDLIRDVSWYRHQQNLSALHLPNVQDVHAEVSE